MARHFGNGIAKGMLVTLKNLLRRPITTQYPEQRLVVSRRIRGTVLAWSEDNCTGCYTCQHSCPHGCISIETAKNSQSTPAEAPCSQRCPANVDAARYIRCLAAGQPEQAVAVVREKIPFPSSCAYVCAHPCETACTRAGIDEPVAIRMLKRYAVDNDTGEWKNGVKAAPASGKQVAVIGAGPAGLTAGYYLARAGHKVTVFEELPTPGGMMLVGIPRYRLPLETMMNDIREIEAAGVIIKTDTHIDDPGSLLNEGHDAVLLATGAHQAQGMGVPGDDDPRVLGGVAFLRDVTLGRKVEIGKRVAVIGGGNTAIDCARTAARLKADSVTIIYRRTRAEMPAAPEEIEEALEEGVNISFLAAPTSVIGENGKLVMECVRMQMGAEDSSGRRRPEPVPGSEYKIELDSIIAAISQTPIIPSAFAVETNKWSCIKVKPENMMTNREGVFSAGDVVLGPATVIEAIAQGRQAASAIDLYLGGSGDISEKLADAETLPERVGEPYQGVRPDHHTISHEERLNTFKGVEIGWQQEDALRETSRCLHCDLKYPVTKYELKGGQCIYCGLCVEACPFNALFMGYEFERATYTLGEQTLQKDELLTPGKRVPSAYAHPELAKDLPAQSLLLDRDK